MPFETIAVHVEGHVATVAMMKPSPDYALGEKVAFELRELRDRLNQDDDVWAVTLTGSGDVFFQGADASTLDSAGDPPQALRSLRAAGSIASIEKPVIAAINADAIDQGLELALACDIRIASDRARFGLTQVRRGLMPWDGGTQRLPRLVGRARAIEMVLTSRTLDAKEALDVGLVNQVVEPGQVAERAREVASTIAGHGPIAARYLKEAVLEGMDMTLDQGLRLEADLNIILQSTADRAEGIRSFLERRRPRYKGE